MTDREALLHAIRDNPTDDTPRLVYADWLDDHARDGTDRARARFIRLQCEAERLPAEDPRRAALRRGAASLQADHGRDWLGTLVELGWSAPEELTFSRGFLADLPVLADEFDFFQLGDRFLKWEHVDTVTLAGQPGRVAAAAALPGMGYVGSVHLRGGPEYPLGGADVALAALSAPPRVTPLRELVVSNAGLTDIGLGYLASNPTFADLRRLVLDGARVSPIGLAQFRGAVFRRGVRSVTVGQRPWRWGPADHGREIAAALGGYDSLDRLALAGYPLGDDGLLELTRSPLARRLTALRLNGDSHLVGPGVVALFDRARWPALTELTLMPTHLSRADLAALMSGDRFATLEVFGAFLMNGTPDTAGRLAANPHVTRLKALELTGGRLGDAGARALMGSPHLARLRRLGLNGPGLSDDTLRALADPEVLPGLRELALTQVNPLSYERRSALRRRFGRGLELDE